MKTLNDIIERAKSLPGRNIALAGAHEVDSLLAVERARVEGIAGSVLVGHSDEIEAAAETAGISLDNYEIVHEPDSKQISATAVKIIKAGRADALMKGLVSTADFMRALLRTEGGLLTAKLLSHIALFEVPAYSKLLGVTDAAINIAPTLDEKATIISNSVSVFQRLGIETPKVACVCAVEKVNPSKMPCTEEAAILAGMNRAGQINGSIVDGPLALDNAVCPEAAKLKKISGEVAGDADIILCPNIESANILYKSLAYLGKCECGAIVVGTSAPVILTSRADSDATKFASIALGIAVS